MIDFEKSIEAYYEREIETIRKLDKEALNAALNLLLDHYEKESTIFTMGNGGSSATASHFVCDFNKGIAGDLPKKFHLECLNDNIPTIMAIANDISFEDIFVYQLQNKLKKGDLVIAISGSGNSHNIIKGVQYAKEVGAQVIGLTGYSGGKLKNLSDIHLNVPIDDMQITEDIHMSFDHMIMSILWRYLAAKNGREAVYKINQ